MNSDNLGPMGQLVQVVRRRSLGPSTVRFEIDRSLTSTSHESYCSAPKADGRRPPDLLAARLFATGQVRVVHVFSNIVTVSIEDGADVDRLEDVLRNLFIHYVSGVVPTAV